MERTVLNFFANKMIKPLLSVYLGKDRTYTYKGFSLVILQGVFHPAFFFSTKYLFAFIDKQPLENKSCLEIGCGSGLLSLLMARKGGSVTAIDISSQAVKNTKLNFERNKKQLKAPFNSIQSDLFDKVDPQTFDFVAINPPYFFNEVKTESQYAWNCGKNGEYFRKLFSQLSEYIHTETKVLMILADNCEIDKIEAIAKDYQFHFELTEQKKILWETNFIYAVKPKK